MAIITVNPGDTIRVKAATAVPGDIIEIAPGTYSNERVYLGPNAGCVSGTLANPITMRAQDPNNPPIISSSVNGPYTLGPTQLVLEDLSYWHIEDIKLDSFTCGGILVWAKTTSITGVILDGIQITNQTYPGSCGGHGGTGSHAIFVGTLQTSPTLTNTGTIIRNCLVDGYISGTSASYDEIVTIGGRSINTIVEDNIIQNVRFGIAFNNLGWGNNTTYSWVPQQPTGTIFRRNKVKNVISSDYSSIAFYNDGGLSATWEENYAEGIRTLVGVSFEPWFPTGATQPTGPFIIRNNAAVLGYVATGGYASGGVVGAFFGSNAINQPPIQNIEFYNNVLIIDSPNYNSYFMKFQRAENVVVHNNIFYERNSGGYDNNICYYATTDDLGNTWGAGQVSDATWQMFCNGYFSEVSDINTTKIWWWPSTSYKTGLISWKTTGKDANSIKHDPTFVNDTLEVVSGYELTNDPGINCGALGVTLSEAPGTITANFSFNSSNLTANFVDTSTATNGITTWNWSFGDGNNSTQQSPTHTYASSGTYNVTLTVSGPDGSDNITQSVEITLIVLTNDPCDNNIILNGDFATNNFTNWLTYSNAAGGTTNPCLTNVLTNGTFSTNDFTGWVWVPNGASSATAATGSAVITINGAGASTQLMQNSINITNGQQYTIRFSARTTSGTNQMYVVVLQDGAPYADLGSGYNLINLTTTLTTFNVTFTANANEANARLQFYLASTSNGTIVIDDVCFGTTSAIVGDTFNASSGQAIATLTGNASNAQIYQNNLTIVAGQLYGVSFDYSGTEGENAYTEIILDDFPYTNLGFIETLPLTAATQNFSATFVATSSALDARFRFGLEGYAGTFLVDNICVGPVIESTIVAGFSFTPTVAEEGSLITFTDTSSATNGITTWSWTFGDGGTSNVQNPTHTYNAPGNYVISLTVTGPDGTDTHTNNILITESAVVLLLPNVAGKYSINAIGTVTLVNMQPNWFDLFSSGTPNLGGIAFVTLNIFSGLGVAVEPVTNTILYFDIDTGAYCLVNSAEAILDSGADSRLAQYGTNFPIASGSGLVARGETYWDWYQAEQGLANTFPTLLSDQMTKKGTL